jgi:ABC-type branched-chain amino acid transport systems, ATPase component
MLAHDMGREDKMAENMILSVRNITMKFDSFMALNDISFDLEKGSILGIIGPNGAGKTTLFNTITGYYQTYSGKILFDGTSVRGMRPDKRCCMGIARTFQITKPFENISILGNVMVGAYYGKSLKKKSSIKDCEKEAYDLIEKVGLSDKINDPAGSLNVSQRKKLELARALSTEPELLLLDEVVGGLNPTEVVDMMEIIKSINRSGVSILMIEHVMKAVMGVSHRILVLNHGEKLAEGEPAEIIKNPDVISAYLGNKREVKHA